MLRWLWLHRERPGFGTAHWWKMWAKRLKTAPQLTASLWCIKRLKSRGAVMELPIFISPVCWNGKVANLKVGRRSFIGRAEIHLHDQVLIGQNVIINDGVRLLTASHDVNDPDFCMVKGSITIEDYAWLAIGVTILPGVKIGQGAVIGAGAVVSKDVPPFTIMVGNPAYALNKTRSSNLSYNPLQGLATFEAWLGRNPVSE